MGARKTGWNERLILDAQKAVSAARRDLDQAMSDGETAPILLRRVEELARAEGELQAYEDAFEFAYRFDRVEALLRLSESAHDPVLVHDVRRAGYLHAVSHVFRGTG